MPSHSPLPHEAGAFSQEVEVNEKEISQSASSPLPENSAADKAMPYMPPPDEPLEPAEVEDRAAIAQLVNDMMNGDGDADDGDIQTSVEEDRPAGGDVAETPATIKSVGRRKTPSSAKMTPASVRSVEAKVASASRPQRVTPRDKSNITNGTAATASTSRKRGSTGPLSGRAAKKTKVVEDNEDEYEVEAIVDDGVDDDTLEHMYEVKWKGYDGTTWEPLTNLTHCKGLIAAYEKKVKKPTTGRNASSARGRGRGARKTSAAKAATAKPTADKSSRGRGRGRGRSATTTRAPKADAGKVAAEKIAAAKKQSASKARAARAAASASSALLQMLPQPRNPEVEKPLVAAGVAPGDLFEEQLAWMGYRIEQCSYTTWN